MQNIEKNRVYKIHCADCDAIYIGQCGCALKHRIYKYKKAILTNIANTGFADHCLKHNHFIDTKNITLPDSYTHLDVYKRQV